MIKNNRHQINELDSFKNEVSANLLKETTMSFTIVMSAGELSEDGQTGRTAFVFDANFSASDIIAAYKKATTEPGKFPDIVDESFAEFRESYFRPEISQKLIAAFKQSEISEQTVKQLVHCVFNSTYFGDDFDELSFKHPLDYASVAKKFCKSFNCDSKYRPTPITLECYARIYLGIVKSELLGLMWDRSVCEHMHIGGYGIS